MSSNAIDSAEFPTNGPPDSSAQAQGEQTSDQTDLDLEALAAKLQESSLKKQLQAIHDLATLGESGRSHSDRLCAPPARHQQPKMPARRPHSLPTAAHGSAYQHLYQADSTKAKAFITESAHGVLMPVSARGIDYSDLQILLVKQAYQLADSSPCKSSVNSQGTALLSVNGSILPK